MNPYIINPLLMQIASPSEKQASNLRMKDLEKEISWSESDIYRFLSPIGTNFDTVVRSKGLKIYQEMMEDDQIKVCIELRKQARLSTPWSIASGVEGEAESDMYADFIKHVLERLEGPFEDDLYEIYSAIEYGFSISELVYQILPDGPFKSKVGLQRIKSREPFNYDFKVDAHGNLLGLTYIGPTIGGYVAPTIISNTGQQQTDESSSRRIGVGTVDNPFSPQKFIIYSYNKQFSNWYGRSDLMAAFRSWIHKKHIMKFWAIWLERYASPFLIAQYKRDAGVKREALTAMDDFLRNMSARQGIRVSDAWNITPVQFSSTSSEVYEKAIENHNRFIAHALLVPNLLGFSSEQQRGSYSLGQKQFDAFIWVLNKIGRDTTEMIVGDQIIKRLIDLNFSEVDPRKIPRFRFESIDEASIQSRTNIVTMLSSAGFLNPEEPWVREFLTLPKRDPDIVLPPPRATKPPFEQPNTERLPATERTPVGEGSRQEKKFSEFQMREPTRFERKMEPLKFKSEIDAAEEGMSLAMMAELERLMNEMIALVKRRKIVARSDAREVARIVMNIGGSRGLKAITKNWLFKIYLDSKLRVLEELGRAGIKIEITKNFQDTPYESWDPLPPQEAIDFFNRKVFARIENLDGKKIQILLATNNLIPYFDQKAFFISGVIRNDILNDAKRVILNALKRGDEASAIEDLRAVFNKYVQQGVVVDDILLQPYRLQTIVRTNLTDAVNEGRNDMMTDPDIAGFVLYWQYSAILDDRTTDYCRCMDGKIFSIERLDELQPAAHYNCRSFTLPVTTFEVDDAKKSGEGIELGEACLGRMFGFKEWKQLAIPIPDVPSEVELPIGNDLHSLMSSEKDR